MALEPELAERTTRLALALETEARAWFDETCHSVEPPDEESPPSSAVYVEDFLKFLQLNKFHRRSYNYPSYSELMTEVERLGCGQSRRLDKGQFLYLIDKWIVEPDIQHELKLAFKVFDTEIRNFLELEELELIVTTYGDKFNEHELREFLRDANIRGSGNVEYDEFVESMFRVAPDMKNIKVDYLYSDPDEDPSVPPLPEPELEPEPEPPPPPPPPAKKGKDKGKKK